MAAAVNVSVIVPIYNGAKYLTECLTSLQLQDMDSIEFICVDDGSTDATPQILRSFAAIDERFRVITKQNTGYGNSMNVGIDAARGKYVSSLDSDDLVTADSFRLLFEASEADMLDFVKADRVYFEGEIGKETAKRNKMATSDHQYGLVFNPSSNPVKWLPNAGLPGMYLREFLDKCRIRLNETPGASFQDTGLTAQAVFNARRARILDEPTYLVRRDNEASSTYDKSKVFCICDEHDFIRAKAKEARGDTDRCLNAAALMRMQGYKWNMWRLPPDSLETFIDRAHMEFVELERCGEVREDCFEPQLWKDVRLLIDHPMELYAQERYGKKLAESKKRLRDSQRRLLAAEKREATIKKSVSWNVGRLATYFPRKIKKQLSQLGLHQ